MRKAAEGRLIPYSTDWALLPARHWANGVFYA